MQYLFGKDQEKRPLAKFSVKYVNRGQIDCRERPAFMNT
jgi:hypothetical protein